MNVYSYRPAGNKPSAKRKRPVKKLVVGILLILIGLWIVFNKPQEQVDNPNQSNAPAVQQNTSQQQPEIEPLPSVQTIVEVFVQNNAGKYSVVVTDLATGTELASYQPDESYFAASIYKLYVAYLGYLDIQNGQHSFDEPFLGEWTRGECLDKMIRESHSPCAEKLWVEQGKETSTKRLKDDYGLSGTSMVGITTTAHDANIILAGLDGRKELNETHTNLFLESLKQNIYRDVIPKALPELVVRDKVGFSEFADYHDVAIVTLPSGRNVAVSYLSRGAGRTRLVNLTQAIFDSLTE